MNTSPRDFMSELQQVSSSSSPQAWKLLRTKDLAVQEIIEERRAAIQSGRLKGRRLFEPLMEGSDNENYEIGLSGDIMGQSEVRLSFDYNSEDDESYSSSSSLPCLSCEDCHESHIEEVTFKQSLYKTLSSPILTANFWSVILSKTYARIKDEVSNIMAEKTRVFEGRYIVIILGMVAIFVLVFAILCMSWTRSFEGHEVILVPT